jgi:hypothetical protein
VVRARPLTLPAASPALATLLPACLAVLSALAMLAAAPSPASAAGGCAPYVTTRIEPNGTTTSKQEPSEKPPEKRNPCWVEQPYPFVEETELEPGVKTVIPFKVTSLAFRAWNRGLAATTGGVWIFNGERWYQNPSFPGSGECPGQTILWAGKLDYWLVGPQGPYNWPNICRYDGETHEWIPLAVPSGHPPGGSITSGACFAWNDCWFFGSYGVVLRWNGQGLTNVSPSPSEGWLLGEYTAAVARQDPAGNPLGVAVAAASHRSEAVEPLPPQPNGAPAPQIYSLAGEPFSPLQFPRPAHPTDLVTVGLDPAGQGWVAGNPPGRSAFGRGAKQETTEKPMPSPLLPISTSGSTTCTGPPESRFTYTGYEPNIEPAGGFLWTSLGVIPTGGEALVGGMSRAPGAGPLSARPVIVKADCDGAVSVTSFLNAQDTGSLQNESPITALAANATNDAWAATEAESPLGGAPTPPRLYRFTDAQRPEAPEGNDLESRPPELEQDKPIFEFIPPKEEAPPPPPPPPIVNQNPSSTLPPAVYDVKVKLHTTKRRSRIYLSLYLTFKVRRPVKLGAQALRRGRVVSVARAKTFSGQTGQLILNVERKRWPTSVQFTT